MTDRYDTRIIFHLEHIAAHLVIFHQFCLALLCIYIHGTELVEIEASAILADPHLFEKDRSR